MKKGIAIMMIFYSIHLYSQNHEILVGTGYSYYLGELNISNSQGIGRLISESLNLKSYKMSYSLGYRYNLKNRLSFGFSYQLSNIGNYDADNSEPTDPNDGMPSVHRNLGFYTAIHQSILDVKFEPFRTETSWNSGKLLVSPFVGVGFGFISFNPKTEYQGQEYALRDLGTEGQGLPGYAKKYSLHEIAVPISIGVKLTPKHRNFSVSLEWNGNITTTDYLDDVSGKYAAKTDFDNAYGPNSINYILADRTNEAFPGVYNAKGDPRGRPEQNDFFVSGQIKFHFYFNSNKSPYYRCYGM